MSDDTAKATVARLSVGSTVYAGVVTVGPTPFQSVTVICCPGVTPPEKVICPYPAPTALPSDGIGWSRT